MRACCRWSIRLAGNWQVLMHWCLWNLRHWNTPSMVQKCRNFPHCHWRKKWSPSAKRQLPFQPPIFFLALWNVNVVRRHDIYDIEASKNLDKIEMKCSGCSGCSELNRFETGTLTCNPWSEIRGDTCFGGESSPVIVETCWKKPWHLRHTCGWSADLKKSTS